MDSILEDSVDSLDDNLVDTISEMFTDEHALDYSSPPLWDDYDDELSDLETVNDNTYYDPFAFSGKRKIKESPKTLWIDETLIFLNQDFNPPLYELALHKEVPGLGALLSFSFENEEKVFNPRILTSKRVHTSLLPKLSHRDSKAFKVIKILESPMEIFPCSYGEDIRVLDVCVLISIPLDKAQVCGGMARIFEASRARGFCPSFTRASHPQLHFGNPISKILSGSPILVFVGGLSVKSHESLAARLGCAETKSYRDDLAFKLIILV
ncbi:hypothetical protein Tco_0622110 [Tanacetum coccineum]